MLLCLWWCCLGAGVLHGQAGEFRHYTVEDGLPSQRVYRAYQDSKGYLWVCTDRGVARFDGYDFEVFTVEDGLPYNDVFGMQEDSRGRLWLHSFAGYATYYDLEKEKFHIIRNPVGKFGSDVIYGEIEHADGNVEIVSVYGSWLTDGVRYLKEMSWDRALPLHHPSKVLRTRITIQRRGEEPYMYVDLPCQGADSTVFPMNCLFNYLWPDSCGISWIISDTIAKGGKEALLRTTNMIGCRAEEKILFHIPISSELLYVRTEYDRMVLNAQLERIYSWPFPSGLTNTVALDREGNAWYCTEADGLYMMTRSRRERLVLLPDEDVRAVAADGDRIWLSTSAGRLYRHVVGNDGCSQMRLGGGRLSYARDILVQVQGLWAIFDQRAIFLPRRLLAGDSVDVQPVQQQSQGDTATRLISTRYYPSQPDRRHTGLSFPHWKTAAQFRNGACAFPDSGRFVGDTLHLRSIFPHTGGIERIYAIEQGLAGAIWYGSPKGLGMRDAGRERLTALRMRYPLLQKSVLDITMAANGWIWVATDGHGMYGFDPQKLFTGMGKADYAWLLHNEIIKSLYAAPDGAVWAATNQGAYEVRHDRDTITTKRRFSTANGLPTNAVNALCIVGPNVYVATQKGLAILPLTDSVRAADTAPPPLMFKMLVNGEPRPEGDIGALAFGHQDVTFIFVCLSYKSDGKIDYRYRLSSDGVGEWETTTLPRADFPMLAPGDYTFEVEATDIGGVQSRRLSRAFVIPSWWQQNWIYGVLVLLSLVLLILAILLRAQYVQRRERMRAAFTDLRLQALQAQMNPHFVSNTLVAVQSLITEGKGEAAKEYLALFADLSRRYLDASHLKYVPLQEELAMLRSYLDLEQLRFGDKFDFEIVADAADLADLVEFPARLLQPLAENAIHHGLVYLKRRGLLRVVVHRAAARVTVRIEDDGIGRVASSRLRAKRRHPQASRGSDLIEGILRAVNAERKLRFELQTMDLYDAAGEASGTRVEVRFQLPDSLFRKSFTHLKKP